MRRGAAGLVVLLALLLAGCSAIPTSGPVNSAPPQVADKLGTVEITPPGPVPGAQRADIVRGFLGAATGQRGGYAVARKYLTPAFAARWDPSTGVTVTDEAERISTDGSSASVSVVAEIHSDGTYRAIAPNAPPQPLRFTLVKVAGEWRIDQAANGIVLQSTYLDRLFKPTALQFFAPGWGALVPDVRWFPNGGLTAEAVVRRLLAGAAGPVASPVTDSAFPTGTRLIGAVRRTGGTALVDLRYPGSAPDAASLSRARRQLEDTLKGLAGIERVAIAIDGTTQPTGRPSALSTVTQQDAPLVLRGGRFGYLSLPAGRLTADAVLGTAVVKADPLAVTASDSLARAAVLTRDRTAALVTPKSLRVVDARAGLVAPTLDAVGPGWLWSVPADAEDFRVGNGTRSFDLQPPADLTSITAVEVSRDGTRMLIAGQQGAVRVVVVVGIVRAADGTPRSLTAAEDDLYPADPAVDVTWADTGVVAVLTRTGSGGNGVLAWPLGNRAASGGQLSSATAIVGGATQSDLTVLAAHSLQQTEAGDTIWQPVATDVTLLAVQR